MDLEKDGIVGEAKTLFLLSSCFLRPEEFPFRFLWVGSASVAGRGPHRTCVCFVLEHSNACLSILGARCGASQGLWSWGHLIRWGADL